MGNKLLACAICCLLEPVFGLSTSVAEQIGAQNSHGDANCQFATLRENKCAHYSQTEGWYHRFGYSGDWKSYYPGEVSLAQWPEAFYASENEHWVDNFSLPQNSQSQPGSLGLAPGLRGGPQNKVCTYKYTESETNLPYQTQENNENAYTFNTNNTNKKWWNVIPDPNQDSENMKIH